MLTVINKKILYIEILLFLALILSSYYYFRNVEIISNTINGIHLGKYFVGIGFITSISILYIFGKSKLSLFEKGHFKIITFFGLLFIPLMLITKIGYEVNYRLGPNKTNKIQAKITKLRADFFPRRHFVYIDFQGNTQILMIQKKLWSDIKEDKKLELQIKEGYFGFDVVTGIKRLKTE